MGQEAGAAARHRADRPWDGRHGGLRLQKHRHGADTEVCDHRGITAGQARSAVGAGGQRSGVETAWGGVVLRVGSLSSGSRDGIATVPTGLL
jgi:hypothetical protein